MFADEHCPEEWYMRRLRLVGDGAESMFEEELPYAFLAGDAISFAEEVASYMRRIRGGN